MHHKLPAILTDDHQRLTFHRLFTAHGMGLLECNAQWNGSRYNEAFQTDNLSAITTASN